MADLSATAAGTYDSTNSTTTGNIVGTEPVLEVIASANDNTYFYDSTNASGSETAYFSLDAMPSDFASMDTLSFRVRYARQGGDDALLTWDTLSVQMLQSDRATALTADITAASSITTTTPTTTSVTAFTGLQAGSKTIWDNAVVAFTYTKSRSKGGFSGNQDAIYAFEITGTYTQGTGAICFLIGPQFSLIGEGGLTF